MAKVFIISNQTATAINKSKFDADSYFNPVQDINGNWCISVEEVEQAKLAYVGSKIPNLTTLQSRLGDAVEFIPPIVKLPWETQVSGGGKARMANTATTEPTIAEVSISDTNTSSIDTVDSKQSVWSRFKQWCIDIKNKLFN